ncbi:MucB/RseB C-terminal domain-containing protein [Castellaniella sp. GW247-6E4]|uniref:MucB/RseB C-terminal domain-containing protein n=1 Tax=Castellaniella sp. GW247-6E4 TaxID=3140380 RepID=UPI003315A2C8
MQQAPARRMRSLLHALAFALAGTLAAPGLLHAQARKTVDPGVVFLQKIQEAARTLDYSGVYTYQQGASMLSSRIVHVVDGMGERERLETLDGEPREYLRQGSVSQTLIPAHKLILIQTSRSDHFPSLLLGDAASIPAHYELRQSPRSYRVAGRDCAVSELLARDALRYSYRICTDLQSHLMLKAQTLDEQGGVVDQVAFGSLRIGKETNTRELDSQWNTRDWRLVEETIQTTDLPARGWRFAYPEGFRPLTQIVRVIRPGHQADQLVLSDGLAAISIFIETFDPERDQNVRQGGMSQGAINVYRKRVATFWLTAVGEVPAQTVRDIAHAVEYVPRAAHQK